MKKFLILLLLFPLVSISQSLPTVYSTIYNQYENPSGGGEKYIERGKILQKEYQDFLKDIDKEYFEFDEEHYEFFGRSDKCDRISDYYKKHGTITERMWIDIDCVCFGEGLDIFANNASSTLASQGNNNYSVSNIIDGDPRTAWVEGDSDYGIGEYFNIVLDVHNLTSVGATLIILNGLQKSVDLWRMNSRVKTFKIYCNNVPTCYLRLEDNMALQYFSIHESLKDSGVLSNLTEFMVTLRFEIVDIYPGERWKDVCVSEISNSNACKKY